MTEIISVRFRSGGKEYYFDPRGQKVKIGDEVIIETAKGPEFGICCRGNAMVEDDKVVKPLRPMLRPATSTAALSSDRSASGTSPSCWAAWGSAGGLTAATPFWNSSSPSPSKWQRPRGFP